MGKLKFKSGETVTTKGVVKKKAKKDKEKGNELAVVDDAPASTSQVLPPLLVFTPLYSPVRDVHLLAALQVLHRLSFLYALFILLKKGFWQCCVYK